MKLEIRPYIGATHSVAISELYIYSDSKIDGYDVFIEGDHEWEHLKQFSEAEFKTLQKAFEAALDYVVAAKIQQAGYPEDMIGWAETHHQVVQYVETALEGYHSQTLHNLQIEGGRAAIWELCIQVTNAYHKKYPHDFDWAESDVDYIDSLDNFLKQQFEA